MKILSELFEIRKAIIEKKERLNEICSPPLKGQVITGMPKGGETLNATETFLERKEKLQTEIQSLFDSLDTKWNLFENECERSNMTNEEIVLLKLRYYYGFSWKKVQNCLQKQFPKKNWNKNLVFRKRRQALDKLDPASVILRYRS